MNHSIALSQLHSRPQSEGSRHRMPAPAQAVHLPICRGMMMTKASFKGQNSRGEDNRRKFIIFNVSTTKIIKSI